MRKKKIVLNCEKLNKKFNGFVWDGENKILLIRPSDEDGNYELDQVNYGYTSKDFYRIAKLKKAWTYSKEERFIGLYIGDKFIVPMGTSDDNIEWVGNFEEPEIKKEAEN